MNTRSLYHYWQLLQGWPMGRHLFSLLIRWVNPYSGQLGAKICELRPGYCRAILQDRRAIRNHLDSIHAIALTNFGELVSGLALVCAMPENVRGIPVSINIEFLKKARGRLSAESHSNLPAISGDIIHRVSTEIKNTDDTTVARVNIDWKIGPRE